MKTTVALVALLASTPALAGWETVTKNERVTVETRTQPGSSVKEIRAQGIVDAPAWVLKNVVDDIDAYTKLIPYTTAARVVGSTQAGQRIAHQRLEMPFMQAREYVVTLEDKVAENDGRKTYVCAWHSASAKYASYVSSSAVRVDINEGSWTFEELADGRTLATFQMAVDPAGSMPAMVVNMAQEITIAHYLDNLEARARLPQYRTPTI